MSREQTTDNPSAASDVLAALTEELDESHDAAPMEVIVRRATDSFLALPDVNPEPAELVTGLLRMCNGVIDSENRKVPRGQAKLPRLRELDHWQIAQVLLRMHRVVRVIQNGANDVGPVAVYQDSGRNEGTYVVSEEGLRALARRYCRRLTVAGFREVFAVLKEEAPRVPECEDPDLIGVNNGILNYRTKELTPFTPDVVLLAKIRVDYVESPPNPIIQREDGSTWDVESWIGGLSDDPERVRLAWHVLGAVTRPNVRWNKAVMLYNENGNNGKGTFMQLAKSLVGAESWSAMSIADFEDRFRLAGVVGATAFGADENSVGAFSEKMANFKATITGDAVMIERKGENAYWYEPRGLMLQCMNSLPKSKDVSQSYYRRLLFWPFDKSFEGREDKAIKADYLKRREVLEYVLWRSLNLPHYYALPEPVASLRALTDFKDVNDPVREFWAEFEREFVWDLLPISFLHDLFLAWSQRTNPRGGGLKKSEVSSRLKSLIAEDGYWEEGQWAASSWMTQPERLIEEYGLRGWGLEFRRDKYRGFRRVGCEEALIAQQEEEAATWKAWKGEGPPNPTADQASDNNNH